MHGLKMTLSNRFEKIIPFVNGYLKITLPKKLTEGLRKICLDKDKSVDEWNTYDFYNWDFPEIKELNMLQVDMVKEFMNTYDSVKHSDIFNFKGWVNIRKDKSWHSPHFHPGIPLIFNVYVSVPEDTSISFMNPAHSSNVYSDVSYHIIKPEEGTMILTPGWWLHWTEPTFKNEDRISMSSNVEIP